jgi:predicted metal-dependent hydrolase
MQVGRTTTYCAQRVHRGNHMQLIVCRSSTEGGGVPFNLDLLKLPLPCIDCVVAHELVHIKISNHSRAFWRMLDRLIPDWRKWRDRLGRAEVT